MITVAAVRTGEKYGLDYVERLFSMVNRHMTVDHDFMLITDRLDAIPKVEGLLAVVPTTEPGWWAKLELFNTAHPLTRPVLYLDLDVVITGSLDPLALYDKPLVAIDDWHLKGLNSSVMRIEPGRGAAIWDLYKVNPEQARKSCRRGDQEWISLVQGASFATWPEDWCVSYRKHCQAQGEPPAGAKVVAFHGRPKPHECDDPWVKEMWR